MAGSFDISQIVDYLTRINLKVAHTDRAQNIIELVFQGNRKQWHMIVSIQQKGAARKLLLVAPHVGTLETTKRLECLEALMAINYRIALGKFGLDLNDGEIRLEESIPLAMDGITFEQFQLAMGAIMQTVSIYQDLLPRIIDGNLSVQETLQACEQAFFHDTAETPATLSSSRQKTDELPELDVNEVMAEVTRIFEKRRE